MRAMLCETPRLKDRTRCVYVSGWWIYVCIFVYQTLGGTAEVNGKLDVSEPEMAHSLVVLPTTYVYTSHSI